MIRQRGAALLLCLLLLIALSLLAVSSASDSRVQVRMAANLAADEQAFRAAQSALAWGEQWLFSLDGETRVPPCGGDCDATTPVRSADSYPPWPEHQPEAWWLDEGRADGFDPVTGARLADRGPGDGPAGRWIVEEIHFEPAGGGRPDTSYYRLIARAAPIGSGSPVVLESIIARPWGDHAWRNAFPAATEPLFCIALTVPAHCGRMAWQRRL